MLYASRTGTRRNLNELRRNGWRLLLSPTNVLNTHGFHYALDNGAWTAHRTGIAWDEAGFLRCVERYAHEADWLVVPDIVGGGRASLDRSVSWLPRLRGSCALLLVAVQDGMSVDDVRASLTPDVGIFIGGSTHWKLQTAHTWGEVARSVGCHLHMGRVNTRRRMRLARRVGCQSVDGTSASRYSVTCEPLTDAARQGALCWD